MDRRRRHSQIILPFCGHDCCTESSCRVSSKIDKVLFRNRQRVLPHRTIYKILSLYENWTTGSEDVFNRWQVLHYIAMRAFWSQLNDSDCLAKLMMLMYNLGGHFGFLLSPREDIFSSIVCYDHETDRLLGFFLRHAYRQKLTFHQRRVADLDVLYMFAMMHPCEVAVASVSPASLHVLLKYGSGCSVPGLRPHATTQRILLNIVEEIIACVRSGQQASRYKILVTCGRLLLRACPQIEKVTLDNRNIDVSGYSSREEAFRAVEEQGGLAGLRNRLGNSPPSLKHSCRLKIRSVLHQNWQLPLGIDEFRIPNTLKDYLNLYSDY